MISYQAEKRKATRERSREEGNPSFGANDKIVFERSRRWEKRKEEKKKERFRGQ